MNWYQCAAIVCFASTICLSCDSGGNAPDDGCGSYQIGKIQGGIHNPGSKPIVPLASSTNFANAEGTQASISWKLEHKNVCTKVHSKASISFSIRNQYADAISVNAVIWYGILKERPMNFTRSVDGTTIELSAWDEFGIRDLYGDGPGEFYLFVDMLFPSTGYWDSDSAFVEDNLLRLDINTEAYEFR